MLVDPEHGADRVRPPDNPDVAGLQHDDESERAARVAVRLPKRNRDRAIEGAGAGCRIAFRNPLVSLKLLRHYRAREAECLNPKGEQEYGRSSESAIALLH